MKKEYVVMQSFTLPQKTAYQLEDLAKKYQMKKSHIVNEAIEVWAMSKQQPVTQQDNPA
jgi:predicted DNA-binding protein